MSLSSAYQAEIPHSDSDILLYSVSQVQSDLLEAAYTYISHDWYKYSLFQDLLQILRPTGSPDCCLLPAYDNQSQDI